MRITRWGEFGVLCTLYIAKAELNSASETDSKGLIAVGAADISESQELPIKYAQQILHRLRKGGIIKSIRGPHGGFRLARPAVEITLKDILMATEGHTFELLCDTKPLGTARCRPKESCGLSYVWSDLQDAINVVLTGKTLKDLLDFETKDVLVPITARKLSVQRKGNQAAVPG